MKIVCAGGGPAGLYFAISMKLRNPSHDITVYERNKPDDTFGFGVVFSDQTLEAFESYDRETYRQIVGHFAYWDDIEIHFRGTTHRIGGNGFCGTSRSMLLKILGRRAHSLGIDVKYGSEADPSKPARVWSENTTPKPNVSSGLFLSNTVMRVCGHAFFIRMAK